jgi:hypothetical protein
LGDFQPMQAAIFRSWGLDSHMPNWHICLIG